MQEMRLGIKNMRGYSLCHSLAGKMTEGCCSHHDGPWMPPRTPAASVNAAVPAMVGVLARRKPLLLIHQDARVFAARLDGAEKLDYPIAANRKIYLHVARGGLKANGYALSGEDALMYTEEGGVS